MPAARPHVRRCAPRCLESEGSSPDNAEVLARVKVCSMHSGRGCRVVGKCSSHDKGHAQPRRGTAQCAPSWVSQSDDKHLRDDGMQPGTDSSNVPKDNRTSPFYGSCRAQHPRAPEPMGDCTRTRVASVQETPCSRLPLQRHPPTPPCPLIWSCRPLTHAHTLPIPLPEGKFARPLSFYFDVFCRNHCTYLYSTITALLYLEQD